MRKKGFYTKKEKRLVKNNFECDKPKKQIVDPDYLLFSLDSRTFYFETSAWTTSGAVHAVDANGKNLRFVTDGGDLRIVQSRPYRGDLIVNQHRYRFRGDTPLGSYNGSHAHPKNDKCQLSDVGMNSRSQRDLVTRSISMRKANEREKKIYFKRPSFPSKHKQPNGEGAIG